MERTRMQQSESLEEEAVLCAVSNHMLVNGLQMECEHFVCNECVAPDGIVYCKRCDKSILISADLNYQNVFDRLAKELKNTSRSKYDSDLASESPTKPSAALPTETPKASRSEPKNRYHSQSNRTLEPSS